jgi:hypothetical protein
VWRWLAADPRDVVDLAGAGTLAVGSESPELSEELRRWRRIVARRRLLALVRRQGAVALGLAALLEILAQLGAIPQWVVVAVPLAALVVSVTVFALRGPSPFGLARLLDDKLGLNDRLATALEIEARGGAATPLERRTSADAAGLLRAGRDDWHASSAPAGRDWWALAAPVAAIAVVVAIGAAASGGSSGGDRLAAGPGGSPAGGATPGEARRERERKLELKRVKREMGLEGKHLHGKRLPGENSPQNQSAPTAGYQQIPQGTGKSSKERGGAAAKGKAPTGKNKANGEAGRSGGPGGHGKSEPNNPKGTTNTSTPGGNGGAKSGGKSGTKKSETAKGASQLPGAGAQGAKPGAKPGQSGANGEGTSQSEKQGGTPGGTNKAGGEQGTTRRSHAKPITGATSQTVRIQPGYAPSRSAEKAAQQPNKPGDSQGGGGKARTAQVAGGTQVGDDFTYVPEAGGALPPGPSAGLQLNYLESLKWVSRLPW